MHISRVDVCACVCSCVRACTGRIVCFMPGPNDVRMRAEGCSRLGTDGIEYLVGCWIRPRMQCAW